MQSLDSSLINEKKYQEWRKNISGLYDIFVRDTLTSPSLTVQWLPSLQKRRGRTQKRVGKMKLKQRLVLGSSNNNHDNHLMIATVLFSDKRLKTDFDSMPSRPKPANCFITIDDKIKHPGVVNRTRYMPQNPAVLATKSSNGDVYIYNIRKIYLAAKKKNTCEPELTLRGLGGGGSAISWNPNRKGYILSCSINERTIRLWDIDAKSSKDGYSLDRFNRCHPSGVIDCAWHCLHSSLFGSAGKDRNIHIWDIRADLKKPAITGKGHKASVNCLSFNYFSDHFLATGSSDQTIAVWDTRMMKSPRHRINWHKFETCQVHWSPNNENILASSGVDDRVLVWDISEIGARRIRDDTKEGPPELLFIHGGHTDNIIDFSWNITEPWLFSSVSQDKVIQVWQMGQHVYENNVAKKSGLKQSTSKQSSICQAVPGSSKSSFSNLLSQINSLSSPSETPTLLEASETASFTEAPKSPDNSISQITTNLPVCPSPKAEQSVRATCNTETALEGLDKPGPSKALDLVPEVPLPCLSPMSKSSIENSPNSIVPEWPSSMESPKSSRWDSTPESVHTFSTSEPPTTPESAKSILFSMKSEKSPKSHLDSEDNDSHGKVKTEGLTEPDLNESPILCTLPNSQLSLQTPSEFPTCQGFLTDGTTEQNPNSSELSSSHMNTCEGLGYSRTCDICSYLKKASEEDHLRLSPDWQIPSHIFSPEGPTISDYSTFLENQNRPETPEFADIPLLDDPSSYSLESILADFQLHPNNQALSDVTSTSYSQEFQDRPFLSEYTASLDSQMPSESHVSCMDILNPSDRLANPDIKTIQNISDHSEESLFSNFQAPSISPASQNIKKTQDVLVYPENTPNIKESQDDPVSSDNVVTQDFQPFPNVSSTSDIQESQNQPLNPQVTVYQDFQMTPESNVSANISKISDSLVNQDIPTSRDV